MTAETPRTKLPLILLAVSLTASAAAAQTLPWPTDPPPTGASTSPWPSAPASPAPMVAQPPMAAPQAPMGAAGQPPADCMPKFLELKNSVEKLRENVDKVAMASKSKSDKEAARKDVCGALTTYTAAESKWAKFIVDNGNRCGIPPEMGKQLTAANAKSQSVRKNVCAERPAGGPSAPSLSDALGTSRQPPAASSRTPSGTFNTLTGNAISR